MAGGEFLFCFECAFAYQEIPFQKSFCSHFRMRVGGKISNLKGRMWGVNHWGSGPHGPIMRSQQLLGLKI